MRTQFDHEKLDVYQQELRFLTWVTDLLATIKARDPKARLGEVVDQLERASLSALLNTAEGNGKRQRQVRAKFFDDARGSATECAACLDALVAKRFCNSEEIEDGKEILLRVVSMLTKLVDRFETVVREDESEYGPESSSFSSSNSPSDREGEKIEDEGEDERIEDERIEDEDEKKEQRL